MKNPYKKMIDSIAKNDRVFTSEKDNYIYISDGYRVIKVAASIYREYIAGQKPCYPHFIESGKGYVYQYSRLDPAAPLDFSECYKKPAIPAASTMIKVKNAGRLPYSNKAADLEIIASNSGAAIAVNAEWLEQAEQAAGEKYSMMAASANDPIRIISDYADIVILPFRYDFMNQYAAALKKRIEGVTE